MDPDRMTEQVERWIGHAVEHYEDDDWDGADAALGIADSFQKLYMMQLREAEVAMMRQRHHVEVTKRLRAEQMLEERAKKRQGLEADPW